MALGGYQVGKMLVNGWYIVNYSGQLWDKKLKLILLIRYYYDQEKEFGVWMEFGWKPAYQGKGGEGGGITILSSDLSSTLVPLDLQQLVVGNIHLFFRKIKII